MSKLPPPTPEEIAAHSSDPIDRCGSGALSTNPATDPLQSACAAHDQAYDYGGTLADEIAADGEFASGALEDAEKAGSVRAWFEYLTFVPLVKLLGRWFWWNRAPETVRNVISPDDQ